MACDCRSPINCYNDKTRYKTMVILYVIDLIFFIIRLSLVSNDISKGLPDRTPFLVPIILFDLIASIPIILCNILYVIMRHCAPILSGGNRSVKYPWHFATMTCVRLHCHKDRPQAILLMRIIIIGCSFLLKFMCFVIGAACSARFQSECTAYTVIAAFALVLSIWVIVVEFVNFFRLWRYNPTDTRNGSSHRTFTASFDAIVKRTHRGHLGFIHHSLLNDQNAAKFRQSRCEQGSQCQLESVHHYLFYHTLESEHPINFEALPAQKKQSLIAFYQTTQAEASNIAQNGFPYGDRGILGSRDHLHLKQSIFFTQSCTAKQSSEAIICARLNLGRVESRVSDEDLRLNDYFGYNDGRCDTVYIVSTRRFYLRMPGQIEKWIITINKDVPVNDTLDGISYQPCI